MGWTSPSILLSHMKSQSSEALMQPGLVPLTQGRVALPVGWTGAPQGKPGRQRQCSGRGRQTGARSVGGQWPERGGDSASPTLKVPGRGSRAISGLMLEVSWPSLPPRCILFSSSPGWVAHTTLDSSRPRALREAGPWPEAPWLLTGWYCRLGGAALTVQFWAPFPRGPQTL